MIEYEQRNMMEYYENKNNKTMVVILNRNEIATLLFEHKEEIYPMKIHWELFMFADAKYLEYVFPFDFKKSKFFKSLCDNIILEPEPEPEPLLFN
jgi:hypothetical protein